MKSKHDQAVNALEMARSIIDQEWMAAGATREELDQDMQIAQLFDKLVTEGRNSKDVVAEWEHKTPSEILREYATPAAQPLNA